MKHTAQSYLEYIIILTAITIATILAARGPVYDAVYEMFEDASTLIDQRPFP